MFCTRATGSPGVREAVGPVRAPAHGDLDGVPALRRLPRRIVRHVVHAVHSAALPRRRLLRRRHPGEYRLHFITFHNRGSRILSRRGAYVAGGMHGGGHAWQREAGGMRGG